jgi:hypothetical protein
MWERTMARRPRVCGVAATILVALLAASPAMARGPHVVGGTLDLAYPGDKPTAVVAHGRAAAVALLRGSPVMAVAGYPRARHGTGRVRVVQLAAKEIAKRSHFTIRGTGSDARTGASLAAVPGAFGRRNAALLIGAPGFDKRGAAFLVPNPARTRRLHPGADDVVTILGATNGDHAGADVAALPDANGDGLPELVIGAPDADPAGRSQAGMVYVVFSGRIKPGDTVRLADRQAALPIYGPAAGARAGSSVTGSRDLDGDRYGDLSVGAPDFADGSGAGYVVHIAPGRPVDLAAANARALAVLGSDGERLGTTVAAPGDLDGNGLREVAFGAPARGASTGAVYVVTPGAREGTISFGRTDERIEGEAPGDRAGSALVAAGQAIGNKQPDLLVGATGVNALARDDNGAGYLVPGPAAVEGIDLARLGGRGVRFAGKTQDGRAGAVLGGGVDVDGDSRKDVLIAAPAPGSAKSSVVLLRSAPVVPRVTTEVKCDAEPAAMVLDTSPGLDAADPQNLRGNALKQLTTHASSDERVLGAVAAAPEPAEVFSPLIPGTLKSERAAGVLDDLVDESLHRPVPDGDLRQAVAIAANDLPRSPKKSAIVVAGPDSIVEPGPAPGVRTDVVGVNVESGSSEEIMLSDLAAASRGLYRRVSVDRLQAQVARFDARRRCEELVQDRPPTIVNTKPAGAHAAQAGEYEFDESAVIGAGKSYADLVQTWTSVDATVELDEVIVREIRPDAPDKVTRFSPEQVGEALGGKQVEVNGITLIGGQGSTFMTLRVGFQHEHDPLSAQPSKHNEKKVHGHGRGKSRGGAAAARDPGTARPDPLYAQFFQPR